MPQFGSIEEKMKNKLKRVKSSFNRVFDHCGKISTDLFGKSLNALKMSF